MNPCLKNSRYDRSAKKALLLSLVLLVSSASDAAIFVWNGAGTDANWSTASNWNGGVVPPNDGTAAIVFAGTNSLSPFADAPWDVASLTFSTNGGAFNLGGSALTIRGGGIYNSNVNAQVINNSITLFTNQIWTAGTNSLLIAGNINLGTNALTIAGSFNSTFSGVISGTGGITKTGTSTNFLSGANTYAGLTTVSAGVMNIQNASALGATNSGTVVASGATLQLQNGITVTNEPLTLSGSGVANAGALRSLASDNTWSGVITLGAAATIGCDANSLTLPGSIVNSAFLTTFTNAGTINVIGTIGSGTGGVTKTGAGTLFLSASNSYGGTTTVSAGVLNVQNASALGTTAAGTTVSSGAALQVQSGIDVAGETLSLSGAGIGNSGALRSLGGSNSWSGTITLAAASTIDADAGTFYIGANIINSTFTETFTNNGTIVLAGVLGGGSGALAKTGTGTLIVNGANSYTGTTTVSGGTLQFGVSGSLPSTSAVTINSAGTLDLSNLSESILSLAGAGTVTLGSGTVTVNNTSSVTFSGVISGTGGLTKTGSGTWTLSGTNTFTGNTVINGGAVSIKADSGLGATNGSVTLNAGTLTTSAAFNTSRAIILGASGGTLNVGGNMTYSGLISGPGALNKIGSKILTLATTNSYLGGTTNGAGTISIGSDLALGAASGPTTFSASATLTTTASFTSSRNVFLNAGTATFSAGTGFTNTLNGIIGGAGVFSKSGSGVLLLNGSNTFTNLLTISAGTLRLGASERLSDLVPINITSSSATFDLNSFTETIGSLAATAGKVTLGSGALITGGNNRTTTNTAVISGTGSYTKIGTGTQIFSGANTYTGPTIVSTGALQISTSERIANSSPLVVSNGATFNMVWNGTNYNETVGSIAGAGNVTLGGTLTAGNTSTAIFSGTISGPGAFTKVGAGTEIFSGTNSFSGATTISVGTLEVDGSSPNSAVTIASAATLSGSGAVGTVAVNSGATNSPRAGAPGTLSSGAETWAGGGDYNWEINNPTGTKGGSSGWDWLNISGTLTITASSGSKFNIKIVSLTPANAAGQVTNFDNTVTYIWTIATASGGISGFDPIKFNLITNSFQNALGAGSFALTQLGNDLNLIFTTAAQAAIKGVQSGTVASTGNGTNTVTLSTAVNPTNAFLIFHSRNNSSVPGGSMIRGRIASSNSVEFVRVTTETSTINVQWYVIEYSAGVKVQRGEILQTNTVINVPLTPIAATNQAFVTWSKTPDSLALSFDDSQPVVAEITSTTNLQFRVSSLATLPVGNPIVWWQVVEFTHPASINVQKGSVTNMTGTNLLATATLNIPADTNNTLVLAGYRTSGSGTSIGARMLRAQLTDASTVTFDRSIVGAPDNIVEIFWQAVQLKDGSIVKQGTVNFASGIAQTNLTLASFNTNRAAAFASVQAVGGQNAGRSPSTGAAVGVGSATLAFASTTQLTLDRNNTSSSADLGWYVVGFGPGSFLTPASGGGSISADTKGGAYTSLTGPLYSEIQNGNVSTGTIILNAPAGFIFDTNATLPTVLVTRVSGSGADALNINGVASGTAVALTTITTNALTFTVTSASSGGVVCSLTWQNVRVRPSAGTPLASGNIISTGTSVIQGVTTNSTSWGFLGEVVGAATKLAIATAPSSTAIAGVDFAQQPVIQVQDQFGNLRSADHSTVVTVTNTGTSVLEGTTNLTVLGGVAAFSGLDYTVAETIKLGFAASGLTAVTSGNIVVSPAGANQLTILTQPSLTATAGIAFAQQPTIRVEDSFGNLVSSDNSTFVNADIDQGSSSLSGSVDVTAKNGVVTFTNLAYPIAETITLVFSSGSLDPETSASITVNYASQTITFAALTNKTYGDADFTVNASASSGLPVTFSIVSGPATISGNVVSLTGAGSVTVRASQAGDATYAAATSVDRSFTVAKASSAIAVASSANPSPTSSNVTFTATVSTPIGTPSGVVQFLSDGTVLGSPITLASGTASVSTASLTHGTHVITAQYVGDANFIGSTNTLSPNQVVNTSPVAGADSLQRTKNSGAKIRIATLLANDTDFDADTLTFVSADSTSAAGGVISVHGAWIIYTPPSGFTNADIFSYVVTDPGGLKATGTVSITIFAHGTQSQNLGSIDNLGNGSSRIRFNGVPGRSYTIQFTESLQTPSWQSLGTTNADALGKFVFTDTPPTNSPARFYRSTEL